MNTDTVRYNIQAYAVSDLYAVPKRGVQLHYVDGHFQIATSAGHQHFYWIKSGWLFRVAAVGYVALDLINGLIKNNFSFSGSKYGIAAAVFATGVVLKKTYKVTLRMRKKYHLEIVKISA